LLAKVKDQNHADRIFLTNKLWFIKNLCMNRSINSAFYIEVTVCLLLNILQVLRADKKLFWNKHESVFFLTNERNIWGYKTSSDNSLLLFPDQQY
jgi:hypothetical protein